MNFEARYIETNDNKTYHLTLYGPHPTVTDMIGPVHNRPEWLTNIITMATVGDHFLNVPDPPPDRILWFLMDENCNLVDIDIFT